MARYASRRRIPTTRWTIFRRARSSDPAVARQAIAELCEHYHAPIYSFFRDKGHDAQRAGDLTQDLFVRLIANDVFATVQPEDGRFRTYLLRCAINQHHNAHRDATRLCRDPGTPILEFDTTEAELGYAVAHPGLDPEQAYDRRWAQTVLERVFARMHAKLQEPKPDDTPEMTAARAARWVWLEPLLRDKAPPGHLAALAEQTGMNPSSLRAYVSRMRRLAEQYVLEELGDQVPKEDTAALASEREHLRAAGLIVPDPRTAVDESA